MRRQNIMCLMMVILLAACATYADKKQAPASDPAAESTAQPEQNGSHEFRNPDKVPESTWRPFKGVLLHHIVANCCYSEAQNTVVLGQDSNGDRKVDRCYQLKGKEGEIYYRIIACPSGLAPVQEPPQRGNNLQCSLP